MTSFVHHGHGVQLHVYEEPKRLPEGVTLRDAQAILPRQQVFTHAKSGSLAPFSDWFRYRLLHENGGLWVDADMLCLRPFDHENPLIFGWQDGQTINNAVLGLPRGHALAERMIERCESPNSPLPGDSWKTRRRKWRQRVLKLNAPAHTTWGDTGPQGLTRAVRELGYTTAATPFWHFYPIHYTNWHCVFDDSMQHNPALIEGSYGLHLWNEMTRRASGFDKNARFPASSLFETLWRRYVTNDS